MKPNNLKESVRAGLIRYRFDGVTKYIDKPPHIFKLIRADKTRGNSNPKIHGGIYGHGSFKEKDQHMSMYFAPQDEVQ